MDKLFRTNIKMIVRTILLILCRHSTRSVLELTQVLRFLIVAYDDSIIVRWWCLTERGDGPQCQRKVSFLRAKEASHHDTKTFDLRGVQRINILLRLASVRRVEGLPRDEDTFVVCFIWLVLWRQLEIDFPGNGGLFATIGCIWRQQFIFADESVAVRDPSQ